MTNTLTIARRLAARGLVVIPVPRPGPQSDGKVPSISWKKYQSERPTHDDLVRWFAQVPRNLAILTGSLSGIVVVDVDGVEGHAWAEEALPPTPWMVQTAKGIHYYFQHRGNLVPNRVRLAGDLPVDVRGDGGYVMGPGSRHASGVWYRCLGDWTQPRRFLPPFDPLWLPTPFEPQAVTKDEERPRLEQFQHACRQSSPVDAVTRARKYLAVIPPPEIGHGSDLATYVAACRLIRGFALPPYAAEHLLWEWAGHRPGWDREWIHQKVQSAVTHAKEPMGALL